MPRLRVQRGALAGEPHQHLSGRRRAARPRPEHQHLARVLLERSDPLADRAGRHVQRLRGGVERALGDDRGESRQLLGVVHMSDATDAAET